MKLFVRGPKTLLALWWLVVATGCAAVTIGMRPATGPDYAPAEGMATVVFVRDSGVARRVNFLVVDKELNFVASLSGNQHAITEIPAGEHTFYVLAENVEPVRAALEAGHTYLVRVRPRAGWMLPRVTAKAVGDMEVSTLHATLSNTTPMVPDQAEGDDWVTKFRGDIQSRISLVEAEWADADEAWRIEHTLATQKSAQL